MIIESLKIKNFGIYKDTHTLDLRVRKRRPIVLIKALNGFGKTTVLTAIQVTLYGRLAPVVRDSKKRFNIFIMDLMNSWNQGDTSLQVDIALMEDGKKNCYSVLREWKLNKDGSDIIESFNVKKNDADDRILTERWLEFIEGLLPMNIMPLFFFDGEKVEAMADMGNSASMLKTSLFSLFGMDIAGKLQDDLRAFLYKYKIDTRPGLNSVLLVEYRNHLAACNEKIRGLHQEKAALAAKLEFLQSQMEKLELKFKKAGGDLYNRRNELNQQAAQIDHKLSWCHAEKNRIMAAEGPLLQVKKLLKAVEKQAKKEIAGGEARIARKFLDQQAEEVIGLIKSEFSGKKVDVFENYFRDKKKALVKGCRVDCYLNLSHAGYAQLLHLQSHALPATAGSLQVLDKEITGLKKEQADLAELITRIPSDIQIQALVEEIDQAREEIDELKLNLIRIEEAVKVAGFRLHEAKKNVKDLLLQHKEEDHQQGRKERIQEFSWLVQQSLLKFKDAVTQFHLVALKKRIKKCFCQLLHKQNFIRRIEIDAESFQLALVKVDGDVIGPDSLSAGERQLLATAIFWALALESGIEAPVIIDTPLGRLDSLHRQNIVQNYFPGAGRQVILLSTDEEITDELFAQIEGQVAHFYTIEFEDSAASSFIRKVS